jgi:hypothetical protein
MRLDSLNDLFIVYDESIRIQDFQIKSSRSDLIQFWMSAIYVYLSSFMRYLDQRSKLDIKSHL